MAPVRVVLLGYPAVTVAGQEVGHLSLKQIGLIGLLAYAHPRPIRRIELAALLWPRSSSSNARHSLSQAIYAIGRKAQGLLQATGAEDLVLRRVQCDLFDFRDAVQHANWPRAAVLYQGCFLQGIDIPNNSDFGDWVDLARTELRSRAQSVVQALLLEGRAEEANRLALTIRECGRRVLPYTGTIGYHTDCDQSLPASVSATPSNRRHPHTVFVGRVEELARLEEFRQHSTRYGFTAVVLEGEAGIGKTSLAERFARLRALRGGIVCCAAGFRAEQHVPFGVVAQWLKCANPVSFNGLPESVRSFLYANFPETEAGDCLALGHHPSVSGGEHRVLENLRHVFDRLASERPLLLLLDDAHLADSASLGFAHYFARRSTSLNTLFLATCRSTSSLESDPFEGWSGQHRMRLNPLSTEDIRAILGRVRPDVPAGVDYVAFLDQKSGRNPLLLISLITSGISPEAVVIPESVMDFFVPVLERVSRDALHLLAALAVAGANHTSKVIAAIAGFDTTAERLRNAAAELMDSGLLCDDHGQGYRTRHGIVGEVALQRLLVADRKALYGRAARVLGAGGQSPPAVLAVQHDMAGDARKAFETAVQAAAASAQLHATREREFFLKLALANAPDAGAAAAVRIELSELYRNLGRPIEALDVVSEHLLTDAPLEQRVLAGGCRLAIRLITVADLDAIDQAWDVIEDVQRLGHALTAAELYMHLAAAVHDLGQPTTTLAAARAALATLECLRDCDRTTAVALRAALALGMHSSTAEGLAQIAALVPRIPAHGLTRVRYLLTNGTLLVAYGKLREAEESLLEAVRLAEQFCTYDLLFSVRNNLGVCYLEQGRFAEAEVQLNEAMWAGNELIGPSEAAVAVDNYATLAYEQGQFDQAVRRARHALAQERSISARGLFLRFGIMGLSLLEMGHVAQAYDAKRQIEELLQRHDYWSNDFSYVETFLARLLTVEGRLDEARRRLETAVEVYRERDVLCRGRLELELARVELKVDPRAAQARAELMLDVLRDTGARPLIERFQAMAARARRRVP
jgi:tetratricopeptide (TPR) repeat protein